MLNTAPTGADPSCKGVKGQRGADSDPERRNILYRERGERRWWGGANIKGRRDGGGSTVNVDEMMSKAGAETSQQHFSLILGWLLATLPPPHTHPPTRYLDKFII